MEDLQDAIEDAQFINAMHEDGPKPSKRWKRLSKEELTVYEAHLKTKSRNGAELEGICGNCLGFYLVSMNTFLLLDNCDVLVYCICC